MGDDRKDDHEAEDELAMLRDVWGCAKDLLALDGSTHGPQAKAALRRAVVAYDDEHADAKR